MPLSDAIPSTQALSGTTSREASEPPATVMPAGLNRLLQASHSTVAALVASLILLIAASDWWVGLNLSLGAAYVVPVLIAAAFYSRAVVVILAMVCSILRFEFGPDASSIQAFLNFFLVMAAYAGSGFFIREVVESRRTLLAFNTQLRQQQALRRRAEDQLKLLAESSPAAIMTLDESGTILAANQAALSLFGAHAGAGLTGTRISGLLPVLDDALKMADLGETFRTAAQCQGRRLNGAPFHAHIWFSTYVTEEGKRLAAIAVDSSDEVREREESNFRQLLTSNRVLTAAVFHEIRNLCASISTAYANLTSGAGHRESRESQVLGAMIGALGRLASSNLRGATRDTLSSVRLQGLLDQFRIVAEPAWSEIDGTLGIQSGDTVPPVVADPQGLMQVLLNLMANSIRAVEHSDVRTMWIEMELRGEKVVIAVQDSGPGIRAPQSLFVPFQSGADQVGLGLYLSRALMRSFGGELRHIPTPRGCRFELELIAADTNGGSHVWRM